jgi:quinoprotein glucose dehydrogenase
MRRIALLLLPLLPLSWTGRGSVASHSITQPDSITIRAGRILDGRGAAIDNATIVVHGGRIVRIGQYSGTPTYDLSAHTVMPGGIDTHVHIGWHFDADGRTHHVQGETREQQLQYAASNARITLESGITTVQSLGAAIDRDLRDAIARGELIGPRIITSAGQVQRGEPTALRERVRTLKAQGADVIKIFASASIRDGGAATMTQEQLDAVCGEAKAHGLRSVVHAHGPESAQRAVRAGCTAIEHGALLDDATLQLMDSARIFYDPNIGLVLQNYLENRPKFEGIGNYNAEGFAYMERAVPQALDVFKRALQRRNIRIVFGTDAVAGAHGRNFEEIIYRVQKGGQSPMSALVSATSLAAQSLGLGDRVGSIAPGYEADIIATSEDPSRDITALRNVVFVMRAGRVVKDPGANGNGSEPASNAAVGWLHYGGDAGAMKYSPLADINRTNVARLEPAWEWRTGESAIPQTDSTKAARPGNFQVTPLVFNDTMVLSTPFNRVVALDAATGTPLWSYDPGAYRFGQPSNGTGFVHRGVALWSDARERRVFMNSRWRLIALDARTGKPIPTFGENGEVKLTRDLLWPVNDLHYTNTSPPVVWGDVVIVGNGVGDRLVYPRDPPGDVQAFDVRTGKRLWAFHTIPQPGEFGNDTWEDESWSRSGHTNVWAPMSVDSARGYVYLPVSTPSNDYYGGARHGNNLFAESVVCLDARTGRRVWHFQTVHHGLWDYDLPAPPVLLTTTVNDRRIDAVAVPGKTGFVYVLDRVNGVPVWPIEERPVPPSDVPGERAAPTQPFPTRPAPFAKQGFGPDDVIDFTPEIRAAALEELKKVRTGPLFTPPSLEGTLVMPGVIGGAGWGGAAWDPASATLFVKATNQPAVMRLIQLPPSDTINAEWSFDRGAGIRVNLPAAAGSERMPSLPISKPPYGTITAIDMKTGEHRWQVPVGDTRSVREHPALRHLNLPRLGVAGAPGPIATAGGLLFVTGGGDTLYALDTADGRILWEHALGAQAYAVPMTYRTRSGRQLVVIATGAGNNSVLKAFALKE